MTVHLWRNSFSINISVLVEFERNECQNSSLENEILNLYILRLNYNKIDIKKNYNKIYILY